LYCLFCDFRTRHNLIWKPWTNGKIKNKWKRKRKGKRNGEPKEFSTFEGRLNGGVYGSVRVFFSTFLYYFPLFRLALCDGNSFYLSPICFDFSFYYYFFFGSYYYSTSFFFLQCPSIFTTSRSYQRNLPNVFVSFLYIYFFATHIESCTNTSK